MILLPLKHIKKRWFESLLLAVAIQCCLTGCVSSVDSRVEKIINYRVNGELSKRFETFLRDENLAVRTRLAYELSLCEDTSVVVALKELLNDDSPLVRNMAAYSLGRFKTSEARKSLLERIEKETDPDVLKEILLSVGEIGTEGDLRSLVLRYEVSDELLMLALKGFLRRGIYTEGRINFLLKKIASGSLRERERAAEILAFAGNSVQVNLSKKVIKSLFFSGEGRLPFYAVLLAGRYGRVDGAFLKSVAKSPDPRIKMKMLASLKGFRAYKSFWERCLRETDVSVRTAAIEYLYKNCSDIDSETLAFVERQCYSGKERSVVAKAVEFVFAEGNIAELRKKVAEVPFRNFRNNAIIGLYYNPSSEKFELLRGFLDDKNPSVRRNAYRYLIEYLVNEYKSGVSDGHSLEEYILWGLDSADPVIAFLALNAAGGSGIYCNDFDPAIISGAKRYLKVTNRAFFVGLMKVMGYLDYDVLREIKEYVDRSGVGEVRDSLYSRLSLDKGGGGSYGVRYKWLKEHGFSPLIRVSTTKGSFVVRCSGFFAPVASLRFIKLIKTHFYDNGKIWKDYGSGMVFFGDTTGTEFLYPGDVVPVEHSPLQFDEWSVGMLNVGGRMQSASFFVVTVPSYNLDEKYTRVGEVVTGRDVVQALDEFDRVLSVELLD